ncbi:MAG: hypothetical protein JSR99_07080 [Proteobacteria bacterium]|nr:hypothetical protein [Pseudomonadota bacterium]
MEHKPSYVRISDLLKMARSDGAAPLGESDHAAGLIEQTFHAIEALTLEEREELLRRLTGWMLVEKFGAESQSALAGLQKFCIAECLFDNPSWNPPSDMILPRPDPTSG